MTLPDVRVSGLVKRFGKHNAVDGIDFEIVPGALVSLLGPSGCGKTTTLRMLAGLVEPDAGEIFFKNEAMTHVPVHRRGVGMLFQNYALFPHMDVAGNVAFGLEMRSSDRKRNAGLVEEALKLVQLASFAGRYPHELSGGQQQRVALARALVIEPTILLLDEPFGALDKNLRESMQLELKDLQRRVHVTTIMVTHDQEEALTLSDIVAVMREGKIEQMGPPAEVYDRPVSRFVARFIGATNFIDGEVVERQGALTRVRTRQGADIVAAGDAAGAPSVTLSLRPEAIRLRPDDGTPAEATDALPAVVERVIYRGVMSEFHLRLKDGAPLVVSRPNGDAAGLIESGRPVIASWDQGRCWIVRPES